MSFSSGQKNQRRTENDNYIRNLKRFLRKSEGAIKKTGGILEAEEEIGV